MELMQCQAEVKGINNPAFALACTETGIKTSKKKEKKKKKKGQKSLERTPAVRVMQMQKLRSLC